MEITYITSSSTVRPKLLESFPSTVYIRKNVVERTYTNEFGDIVTYYDYDEAALSHEEYDEYSAQLIMENAIKGQEDSAKIANIETGMGNNDINQFTIMEAIADLYEMIAAKP